jgi:hypothetical protein
MSRRGLPPGSGLESAPRQETAVPPVPARAARGDWSLCTSAIRVAGVRAWTIAPVSGDPGFAVVVGDALEGAL